MSHELEVINGQAQVMLREDAWHRLGTVVGANFTWLDALAQDLSITWPVEKVALSTLVDEELKLATEQYVALRSDGTILASGIGETWAAFDPEVAYEFVTFLRDEYGMEANLESLGAIRSGTQWFMSFARGSYKIGDFDVNSHITACGSFDQSWKMSVLFDETIAVCANTIAAVQRAGKKMYSFKQTSGIFDRIEEAKNVVRLQREREVGFKQLGEQLLATPVPELTYKAMVNDLFPVTDDVPVKSRNVNGVAREKVRALYTNASGEVPVAAGAEGTGWAFVQAVNTYENWGAPIRKAKGVGEATTRAFRQIDSVVGGKQDLTDRALELVLA